MFREAAFQSIAPATVFDLNRAQVRAQISALQEFRERVLEQRRGSQVHRVLERGQMWAQTARTEQVADPQRRDQLLAECPHVNDFAVESSQRRKRRLAIEVEIRGI